MLRRIIEIDEKKCNGCGICAKACHEGAIGIVNGKARLLRDDYCDGLGDCLPACPMNAISFTEREAAEYNAEEVKKNMEKKKAARAARNARESMLAQWPCQLKLMPVSAPYYLDADLLIAADCTAYAYAEMHEEFMAGRICIIACPKLDGVDYSLKLAEILKNNDINSIVLTRMEVPCCGGLENMLKRALMMSGKSIPLEVVTISIKGGIKSVLTF